MSYMLGFECWYMYCLVFFDFYYCQRELTPVFCMQGNGVKNLRLRNAAWFYRVELSENVKHFRYSYVIIRSNDPWRHTRVLIFDEDYVSRVMGRIIIWFVRRHTQLFFPMAELKSSALVENAWLSANIDESDFSRALQKGPVRNHGQFLHSIITKSDVVIFIIIMGMRL